ncbi:efflux RND transporter permease subunit [Paludisphaera rhizosphaerae]|uniref:efflux RND transporter permease subunit n=1 Tax=Paludisphaera rhizosphaerae TaxID=2711216 RepID=UPI0013E9F5EF|nr:efflux RND transporter permease subunit [Paludisphaera rhizosphaerae]
MIDRIIGWSIRNRVLVLLAACTTAAWGAYAAWVAPVDAIPDLSENQVIVHAEWPGHGPSEIDQQVTTPVGRDLNGVRGVKTIRSSSDFGASTLWVIFDDSVDVATARRRLADRLASSDARDRLPTGVVPRLAPDAPATGQIFWYTIEGGSLDLGRLRAIQDWYVKPQLAAVTGVAEVASVGGMAAEFQVEADPIRLRLHKVALADLVQAVGAGNGASGGGVLHQANAEKVVRSSNWLGQRDGQFDPDQALEDLRRLIVPTLDARTVALEDVASVSLGPQPRRGALEKDGVEVVGGVVLMANGENPLELTRRLKAKVRELAAGLPSGVRIIPMYDRTPLILGAVETVSGTIVEAMLAASLCVVLVLKHLRAALAVALTAPIAVLASFGALELFRRLGVADVQTNAMSLAGLAISIGVLVDSSIVMTENVLHSLHQRFGDQRVRGDTSEIVFNACRQVGRPIVYSILVMLVSFLPVFVLGGLEGRMFRPLAATKTLAMSACAILAVTLVPALSSMLVRGRVRGESASRLVQGIVEVYRPVLDRLIDRPAPLLWILGSTFVVASAAVGSQWLFLTALAGGMLAVGLTSSSLVGRPLGMLTLTLVALVADSTIEPLGREFLTPLDEGMVMDMPISVPRMSITQGVDDLKARDMILCRFPEVAMVVGKLGRAETPTDPAPLDMIETMVEFHPQEYWPARAIAPAEVRRRVADVAAVMVRDGLIAPQEPAALDEIAESTVLLLDAQLREFCYQRNRELFRSAGFDEASWRLAGLSNEALLRWREHVRTLDAELRDRGPALLARLAIEETLQRAGSRNPALTAYIAELKRRRSSLGVVHHQSTTPEHAMSRTATMPSGLSPQPAIDALQEELTETLRSDLTLRRKRREDLIGFGGELDRAVPMPGWTNVWTMPIQNRVDMLSTGVNTMVGVRVLGRDLDQVVTVSQKIAEVLKTVRGAVDVVADPLRGKEVVEVLADRDRASRLGVAVAEINGVVETAMSGTIASTIVAGPERTPIRVRYAREARIDEDSIRAILVRSLPPGSTGPPRLIPLSDVANVVVRDGPASIKGENGLPRNYVRLNVRDRDAADFVAEARQTVRDRVKLPEGCFVEWTGQFEHAARARRTLTIVIPVALALIFGLLWATYRDLADAALVMLAVPGALAGGVVCQWLFGARFSVTIWIGYIACFGMATATGVIMLVYLRDAVASAGGVERLDAPGLRRAVLDGAVHRLRPKLLTEATIVLGLAPMLWAGGVGGEIIRPMAAPVLGGLLIADEVIDLLLPILFYRVRLARLSSKSIHERPAA